MTSNKFKVVGGMQYEIQILNLGTLVQFGTPGFDGTESKINSAHDFLQRLAQKIEWNKTVNGEKQYRAKAYLRSIIMGSNLLDSFVLVPASLLINSIKLNIENTTDKDEKKSWAGVLKYVQECMSSGVQYFIIDGQNRLNESLIPYFSNKLVFGKDKLDIEHSNGKKVSLAGKYFKDLPRDVQDYLSAIEIPVVIALQGDVDQFSQSLIWKNEGIAWDSWQKLLQVNWYTKFRQQISEIASGSDIKGDQYCLAALGRITNKPYSYDINGHDLFVAECLVWMETKTQFTKPKEFESYFRGKDIKNKYLKALKTYLTEFGKVYKDGPLISNVELRNYVMLRYALDYPKEFSTITIPSWRVNGGEGFAKVYEIVNEVLMKDPEKFGELPLHLYTKQADGTTTKNKNPGSYVYFNSEKKQSDLFGRLSILFNVLTNAKKLKACQQMKDDLFNSRYVVEVDRSRMKTLEEAYVDNPLDSRGRKVPVSKLSSKHFDRGHKYPWSKGGKNDEIVIQPIRDNRQGKDDYVA
jgi:hypothetical protein